MISDEEKKRILATKPPTFTMDALRALASLVARYTSPSQVASILKEFGFERKIEKPHEAEAALIEAFEMLRMDANDNEIREILEALLTLYGTLIDEKLHERGDSLIHQAREILRRAHFNVAFHTVRKKYLIMPFEGPVHGIVMRAESATERDFLDREKRSVRIADSSGTNALFVFTLSKDGTLARQTPIKGDKPYALEKDSRRHKTLKALVGCKSGNYCKTVDLAEGAECTQTEFRKSCEELKGQFCKHFKGITRKDVIDSKAKSGYRLHPQVRII